MSFSGGDAAARPAPVVPSAVLATLIFVICEAMLFAGFISAFAIVRASDIGAWPPPGQPRLPVGETALNTLVLLTSGALLLMARRSFRRCDGSALRLMAGSIGLGAFFVGFQGVEWLALIREGLTLTSSNHGSFFYLIVGAHALHAVAALVVLANAARLLRHGALGEDHMAAAAVFWYFVVALWPVLYVQVYL